MDYGIEIHPWDIAEEGTDQTLAQAASLGVTTLSLTATWPGKAILRPRGAAKRLHFPERASVYFRCDDDLWKDDDLRPHQAELVLIEDYFDTLPVRAQREGLSVEARVVFLPYAPPPRQPRRAKKATERPFSVEKLCVRNAFGDRLPGYLCPARPEVRAYFVKLVGDVARYGVSSVAIEDYGFPLFDFGRMPGAEVLAGSPSARFLMGVCFCDSCVERGEAMGIETSPLAWRVRTFLERVLSGEPGRTPPLTESPDGLAEIDDLLPAYLRVRNDIVGTLVRDLRASLREEVRLVAFPGSRFPATQAWREGGEVSRLAAGADAVRLQGGSPDAGKLAHDLVQARDRIGARADGGPRAGLGLRLRPGTVHAPTYEAFAEKVEIARDLKVNEIVFAGLGEVTHAHLRWIAQAAQA